MVSSPGVLEVAINNFCKTSSLFSLTYKRIMSHVCFQHITNKDILLVKFLMSEKVEK